MALESRLAEVGDARSLIPLVLTLGYEASEADLRRRIERIVGDSDHGLYLVTDGPHGIVGFIHVTVSVSVLTRPRADVHAMCVAADHRKQGVGRTLLQRAQRWANERGLDEVLLRGAPHRTDLAKFCSAVGYERTAEDHVYARPGGARTEPTDPTAND